MTSDIGREARGRWLDAVIEELGRAGAVTAQLGLPGLGGRIAAARAEAEALRARAARVEA